MLRKKFQMVEVVVPTGSSNFRIQLLDQPYLRGVQILQIETYCALDVPLSAQQNTVVSMAQLQSASITLYTNDPDKQTVNANGSVTSQDSAENYMLLPMVTFRNMDNGGTTQPFNRNPFVMAGSTIYWEKSYITLAAGLGNTTAPVSFLIGVTFQGNALS